MYCRRCGTPGATGAAFCSRCGNPLDRDPAVAAGAGSIESWLVPAILVTLLCCAPPGIVAIVYASRAQASQRVGDVATAAEAALKARNWTLAGFLLGLVPVSLYAVMFLLGLIDT